MRLVPYIFSSVLLGATLVACNNDNTGRNNGPGATNASGMRGTEQGSQTGTSTAANQQRGQQDQATVSMSCLHSMDRGGWRSLGLDADQLTRVEQLQQSSMATMSPGSNVQGGMQGSGTGTQGTGTQGTQATGGTTQRDRTSTGQVGGTSNTAPQGGTASGGTEGTVRSSPNSGQVSGASPSGMDQGTQSDLSAILTSEQMASLARICTNGNSSRSMR